MSLPSILRPLATHLRRRREWYLAPLFFGAVVSFIHREIWAGKEGIGWDLIESYWGDLAFLAREFGRHNFPLWNPFERGGVPAIADPQPAIFYPVQWLLALWGALWGETSWRLIEFKELLHHALAGTTTYLFLRTRRLPWQAALAGGLAVVGSEALYVYKSNNFLQAIAWAPLGWVALDGVLDRPDPARAVGLAGALYLIASVGSPPGYFYALLLVGSYGAFRVAERAIGSRSSPEPARAFWLKVAGAMAVAAALVVATQLLLLLPVRELLALSPRANRTLDFALRGECAPMMTLASLVAPQARAYIANCGLLAIVLAALAITLSPRRDRGAPILFAVLGTFLLVLSAGAKTPVLGWLVVHAPGFGMFQQSCRYIAPFPLAMGPLAGYGMAALLDPGSRTRAKAAWVIVLGIIATAGTAWLARGNPKLVQEHVLFVLPALAMGATAALAIALVALPRRWIFPLAAIVPVILYVDAIEVMRRAPGYQHRPDNLEDRIKIADLDLSQWRVYDEFLLEQRAGSRLGLRELRGYTSADPLSRNDYLQILNELRAGNLQVLGEFNVRYVFYGPHSLKGWSRKLLRTAPEIAAPKRFRRVRPAIYETLHPAPWVAWYGAVKRMPGPSVLPALRTARDDNGVRRFAIVADEDASAPGAPTIPALPAPDKSPPGVPGKVTAFGTEAVDVSIDAPADGVVVLNEFMFPGWHVEIDGREAQPLTIDLCLRGVVVTKGPHQIRWRFTPRHFWPLFSLWVIAWLTAGVILAVSCLRARRRSHRSARPAPLPAETLEL